MISMYEVSVPVFVRGLTNLSAILRKAEEQAVERKIDAGFLLNDRLAPDMFPLTRQVQIACDHAKGAPTRLAGLEVPRHEDTETTFAELQARIARVLDLVKDIPASQIDGSEEREIVLPGRTRSLTFTGRAYLLDFALPNFFFHLTTAYAILRHNGIVLGKRDFLGPLG